MAVRTVDYLKSKFEDFDTPKGSEFADLIDSCYNNSVSGETTFFSPITAKNVFRCNNIVIAASNGEKYKLIVTETGQVSATLA